MEILNGLVLVLIALFATGCVSDHGGGSLPMGRVENGSQSSIVEPREVVIKDEAGWRLLWVEHQPSGQPARPLPEIDFTKEMVIFVATGQRFSGGFAIEIEKVVFAHGRLEISIRRTFPAPGAMVSQALTAPFDIVTVPRSNLLCEFVDKGVGSSF